MLLGPPVATLTETLLRRCQPAGRTGARRFLRCARIGAGHRLRPLRPDRVAVPARRSHRRHHHRQRSRDDPARRALRLQGLLRRRHPARRAARRRRRPRRGSIAVCIDNREAASRIVDLVHAEFPGTKLYVRSFDRRHTLALIAKGVDFELRETYESALVFGRKTLEALGLDPSAPRRSRNSSVAAISIVSPLQQAEGLSAGVGLAAHAHGAGAAEHAGARGQAAQSGSRRNHQPTAGRRVTLARWNAAGSSGCLQSERRGVSIRTAADRRGLAAATSVTAFATEQSNMVIQSAVNAWIS